MTPCTIQLEHSLSEQYKTSKCMKNVANAKGVLGTFLEEDFPKRPKVFWVDKRCIISNKRTPNGWKSDIKQPIMLYTLDIAHWTKEVWNFVSLQRTNFKDIEVRLQRASTNYQAQDIGNKTRRFNAESFVGETWTTFLFKPTSLLCLVERGGVTNYVKT